VSYLIDSDIVVDWLRGKTAAVTLLAGLAPEGIAIRLITYGEIYEGIYFGRNPQRSTQLCQDFLQSIRVLPLNRRILRGFARLRGTLRQQGMQLADPDLLIAATAIYHDLTLVTGNARHFEQAPNLKRHT